MAKQIALEDEDVIEFRTDDEYLIDGMVPAFVENCTHQDMEDMPPNEFYMTACKHCGQLMMPSLRKANKPRVWEQANGRVTLPVTRDKICEAMVTIMFAYKPNYR